MTQDSRWSIWEYFQGMDYFWGWLSVHGIFSYYLSLKIMILDWLTCGRCLTAERIRYFYRCNPKDNRKLQWIFACYWFSENGIIYEVIFFCYKQLFESYGMHSFRWSTSMFQLTFWYRDLYKVCKNFYSLSVIRNVFWPFSMQYMEQYVFSVLQVSSAFMRPNMTGPL